MQGYVTSNGAVITLSVVAYMPGKSSDDISVRIARLEHIIEMALPQFLPPGTPGDPGGSAGRHSQDDETRSLPDEQDPRNGTFQSGKWYGNSASGSIAPGSVLEQVICPLVRPRVSCPEQAQLEHVVMPSPGDKSGNGLHPFEMTMPAPNDSLLDAVQNGLEPSAADNLKTLVQECGVSPHKVAELFQELPPTRTSAVLVDYYFQTMYVRIFVLFFKITQPSQ